MARSWSWKGYMSSLLVCIALDYFYDLMHETACNGWNQAQ